MDFILISVWNQEGWCMNAFVSLPIGSSLLVGFVDQTCSFPGR